MKQEDLEFMEEIFNRSRWLFYGEFEVYLNSFLKQIFEFGFDHYGWAEEDKFTRQVLAGYWAILSELVALDLAEYGTSPRGSWLTEDGERFKKLIMENKNAIKETQEYIYKQLH